MVQHVELEEKISLEDYEAVTHLTSALAEMKNVARGIVPTLQKRRIWMVNSTAQGGGVAEMLPRVVSLLNELGLETRWSVLQTDDPRFFSITKRIHNLIHDSGEGDFTEEDRRIYEDVNRKNARELAKELTADDILIVHDPQPMALGSFLKEEKGNLLLWRSHIGMDVRSDRTRSAWDFLRPYARNYDHGVFTAAEYIPDYFSTRGSVIYPAIDPLNHKNRELPPVKLMGILCNAGLSLEHNPVLTPPFSSRAMRLRSDGTFGSATEPDEIGLLFRPIVTQISRWDRLKGFAPLMKGFALLKEKQEEYAASHGERHRSRLNIVRLVLAGPDPSSIQDDPEGQEVLEELKEMYGKLPEEVRKDIILLALPMESRKENALMVNVLQRASSIVVQNSLREGFGLTATEAMWKRKPLLSSSACGLRQQIREGVEGSLVRDSEQPEEIARRLNDLLADPMNRDHFGSNAQRRVHDNFLVFSQVRNWLQLLSSVAGS